MPGWRDYPRVPVAGVRKAPRHEIAGCGRQQCRGGYGDLATSSGAPVIRDRITTNVRFNSVVKTGVPGFIPRVAVN
jgi:hypothetical protein